MVALGIESPSVTDMPPGPLTPGEEFSDEVSLLQSG